LGGTLTNWQTITHSIKRLRSLEETLSSAHTSGLTKKELLQMMRERDKLERALGGIKDMGGLPSMLFVIDTNKESIAVAEARKLAIPVAAVLDSNSDPDGITYPIPGNDDASRAIAVYCDIVARAIIDGLSESQLASGTDVGESETVLEDLSEGVSKPVPSPETADAESQPSAASE
jgi:small subunit ribosomal protein S2